MRSYLAKLWSPRVLAPVLAVSLAANVFLAAVFGGALLGKRFPFLLFARNQVSEVIDGLPNARQQEIRTMVRQEIFPDLRRAFAEQQQLRRDLTTVIAAPGVSREALETRFAAIRQATGDAQKRMQDRFIAIILSLPPQERQALAAGVRRITR